MHPVTERADMTTDQQMKALADNATEGPWKAKDDEYDFFYSVVNNYNENENIEYPLEIELRAGKSIEDTAFIAACREWVPDAVRRLEIAAETIKLANENTERYKDRWREAVARNDALEKQIGAVLDLHKPEVIAIHEGYGAETWCPTCREYYPCQTIKALEEES